MISFIKRCAFFVLFSSEAVSWAQGVSLSDVTKRIGKYLQYAYSRDKECGGASSAATGQL